MERATLKEAIKEELRYQEVKPVDLLSVMIDDLAGKEGMDHIDILEEYIVKLSEED